MKIAVIGAKGIPAASGGVEAHVDGLARALVRAGHEVAVYVRPWYTPRALEDAGGARLVHLPTLKTKHLDAAVHCLLASIHVLFTRADLIHYHAIGPAAFGIIPRLCGRRLVVTVHRRDWEADKWKSPARALLKAAERVSVRIPQGLIAVSASVGEALRREYGADPAVIPNGLAAPARRPPGRMTARFGLESGGYILFLGRLVPEKRPDRLIQAFRDSRARAEGLKLVLAGASSGTDGYVRGLKDAAAGDPAIVFTGQAVGEDRDELFSNALLFVLPSRLEGLPIALLEARAAGLACLVSDIPPHREIVADGTDGRLFRTDDVADLRSRLDEMLADRARLREIGARARAAASAYPDWDEVARRTLAVYRSALGLGA